VPVLSLNKYLSSVEFGAPPHFKHVDNLSNNISRFDKNADAIYRDLKKA